MELIKLAPALSGIIAALAFAVATATFIKGVLEFRNQNTLKRFEKFAELEEKFKSGQIYAICMLLETDNARLSELDLQEKYKFLGFYEQIAIMYNSGLLKPDIAHYMFGYFAIRCLNSEHFWRDLNKESSYWALFVAFASEMQRIERTFPSKFDPKKLKV